MHAFTDEAVDSPGKRPSGSVTPSRTTRIANAVGRPTIRQLEYLVALDSHGHIGRAAAACFVSQPTLSTQIRQLERHLGVAITERVGRGIVVTPAGHELAVRARVVLRDTDEMLEWGRSGSADLSGPLRVAAIPTAAPYLFARMLTVIRDRHPRVQLCLNELNMSELLKELAAVQLDLGLLALPVTDDDLEHTVVFGEPFLLAMAPRHRLARQPTVTVGDLAGETLLLLEDGHCERCQLLKACRSAGAREVTKGGTSLTTICQMVAADMGVTLLPASAAPREARRGSGIVVRAFSDVSASRQLALVWRRRSPSAPLYRELAGLLAARLPDLGSGAMLALTPDGQKPDAAAATPRG